jgi:hypothetical protein
MGACCKCCAKVDEVERPIFTEDKVCVVLRGGGGSLCLLRGRGARARDGCARPVIFFCWTCLFVRLPLPPPLGCMPARPRAPRPAPHMELPPSQDRKCRDVVCLLLFIVFWIGMFIIAGVSVSKGEPGRLVYGIDYQGNTCGVSSLSAQQQTYYPKIMGECAIWPPCARHTRTIPPVFE